MLPETKNSYNIIFVLIYDGNGFIIDGLGQMIHVIPRVDRILVTHNRFHSDIKDINSAAVTKNTYVRQ